MILSLINLFYSLLKHPKVFYIFFSFLWPFCLFLLVYLLFYIYKKKLISQDASLKQLIKVDNFFISWCITILYVCFYLVFFLYLRYLQLGNPFDVKKFFSNFWTQVELVTQYSLYNQLIVILFLVILILLWLLIFIKLQRYMLNHIWKLSFYYANINQLNPLLNDSLFETFMVKINYIRHCFNFFYLLFPQFKYFKGDHYYLMYVLFTLLPSLFLLFFFIAELLLNNFIIYYLYYYLPIYMLIMIWVRGSCGVWFYSDGNYSKILIEIAYGSPNIVYVNISSSDEKMMKEFLLNPLKKSFIYDFPDLKAHPFNMGSFFTHSLEDNFLPIDFKRRFAWTYLPPVSSKEPIYYSYYPLLNPTIYGIEEGFIYYNSLANKGFILDELIKIDDRFFVNDPEDAEVMQELLLRKKMLNKGF